MSTVEEIREIPEKYKKYGERLNEIFEKHQINEVKSLISKLRDDDDFKKDWNEFWKDVATNEGGKVSLTTIGVIVGLALGGVGIAAMGGAIGLPIAAILGAGGFLGGAAFDARGFFSKEKKITTKISKETKLALEQQAEESGISVKEHVKQVLEEYVINNAIAMIESDENKNSKN